MKKNLECVKNMFVDMSKYKYIFIFIGSIFILEWFFISELYLSSWASLYVCFMLSAIDIKKTFRKKILSGVLYFISLALFFCVYYYVFRKDIKELCDVIFSLFIPFSYYFVYEFLLKSKMKEIQKYEDEKIKKSNNKTI